MVRAASFSDCVQAIFVIMLLRPVWRASLRAFGDWLMNRAKKKCASGMVWETASLHPAHRHYWCDLSVGVGNAHPRIYNARRGIQLPVLERVNAHSTLHSDPDNTLITVHLTSTLYFNASTLHSSLAFPTISRPPFYVSFNHTSACGLRL